MEPPVLLEGDLQIPVAAELKESSPTCHARSAHPAAGTVVIGLAVGMTNFEKLGSSKSTRQSKEETIYSLTLSSIIFIGDYTLIYLPGLNSFTSSRSQESLGMAWHH